MNELDTRLNALLAKCKDDPGMFNSAILRRPRYWWRQEEMGRSVVSYRKTVVYSGNSIGKDYFIGGLVPWWLYTRPNSLVIVTGPSQTLLGTVTWKEIRKAINGAIFPMGAKISNGVKASPQTVRLCPGWEALGFSTTSIERASGQHNRDLLVVVEEASGVEDELWDAIAGLKYSRLIAIGNPIRSKGEFVRMIKQADDDKRQGIDPSIGVNAIRIPSTDSPDADKVKSEYGLADKTWIEAESRRYGKGSLWVRSHIEARIPEVDAENLIPEAWVDWSGSPSCSRRYPPLDPRAGRRRVACDLGEGVGRDSSAVLCRDDMGVLDFEGGNAMGLAEAAEVMARYKRKWGLDDRDLSYDRLGIGREMPNHLRKHGIVDAIGYVGEGRPQDPQFTNARTEAAWRMKTRLDPDWCPDPRSPQVAQAPFVLNVGDHFDRFRRELIALTYHLVGRQTALVTKKDLLTILGNSPDYADVLIQSFAPRVS